MRPFADFADENQVSNRIRIVVGLAIVVAVLCGVVASALFDLQAGLLFVIIPAFVLSSLAGVFGWVGPVDRKSRATYQAYLATLPISQVCSAAFDPSVSPADRVRVREYLEKSWPQWGKSVSVA